MPVKKKGSKKPNAQQIYSVLENAKKMKQELFAQMQVALDKKKLQNLKKKLSV